MNKKVHVPVLLEEAILALAIKTSGVYIDGTYGRGGHSASILAGLDETGKLIAFDKDMDAVINAKERLGENKNFIVVHDSFANMLSVGNTLEIVNKVDGILLDLGVSSVQLDHAERGFSFLREGPLDMRMNVFAGITAAEWINSATEQEIANVIWQYGEEKESRKIARAIIQYRNSKKFTTTTQLAELISKTKSTYRVKSIHPATKSFQAIRIFINKELDALKQGLAVSLELLKSKGRLVVISFHSLEDRIVKRFFQYHAKREQTWCAATGKLAERLPSIKFIQKKVRPSLTEKEKNVRARSAIMRVVEKV